MLFSEDPAPSVEGALVNFDRGGVVPKSAQHGADPVGGGKRIGVLGAEHRRPSAREPLGEIASGSVVTPASLVPNGIDGGAP